MKHKHKHVISSTQTISTVGVGVNLMHLAFSLYTLDFGIAEAINCLCEEIPQATQDEPRPWLSKPTNVRG